MVDRESEFNIYRQPEKCGQKRYFKVNGRGQRKKQENLANIFELLNINFHDSTKTEDVSHLEANKDLNQAKVPPVNNYKFDENIEDVSFIAQKYEEVKKPISWSKLK